jgi:hypothetical protein
LHEYILSRTERNHCIYGKKITKIHLNANVKLWDSHIDKYTKYDIIYLRLKKASIVENSLLPRARRRMKMTTYKYEDEHWKAGCSVLFMHLAIIIVGTAIPVLWFSLDGDLWLLISIVGALIHFVMRRKEFRFEVPENSSYLVTWDDKLYAAGPGVWWKSMGADVKEDNKFSTESQPFTGTDSIPCKEGERLETNYIIQWATINAAIQNARGRIATEQQMKSHAEKFFGEIARNGGTGLPDGESLLLKKDQIAREFEQHFSTDTDFISNFASHFGAKVELAFFKTPLDYDPASRAALAKKFEGRERSKVEQFRRATIVVLKIGLKHLSSLLQLMGKVTCQSRDSISELIFVGLIQKRQKPSLIS